MRQPIAWALYRPVTKPRRQFIVSLIPPPETRPLPVFRTSHQLHSQGIALHIARDGQEMLIGLHRERFEAALIDGAGPGGVMVGMPALRMGDGDPPQDFGECTILSRPEEEMPVIRHQTIGCNADRSLGVGFSQDIFEGGIVSRFLKYEESSDPTVQDMIREVSSSKAWAVWHDGVL